MISYTELQMAPFLLSQGLLTEDNLKESLQEATGKGQSLWEILVPEKISPSQWQRLKKEFFNHSREYRAQKHRDDSLVYQAFRQTRYISDKELDRAMEECEDDPVKSLEEALLEKGKITSSTVAGVLNVQTEPYFFCPTCQYTLGLEKCYPWWVVICPICEGKLLERDRNSKEYEEQKTRTGKTLSPLLKDGGDLSRELVDFDRYEIIKKLGEGGMGEVYQALDTRLDRLVALKVIATHKVKGQDALKRFQKEVQLMASLRHPGIIPVYDSGQVGDRFYYTMAYVEGKDLRQWVQDQGKVALAQTLEIMIQVCSAVEHAHNQGIIHRDIKPDNIMIDDEGTPLLMDFGLARLTDDEEQLTQTGAIVGSPEFMSPEQAYGEKDLSYETDIYALGGTLYFTLTGKPPFQADDILVLLRQVTEKKPLSIRARRPDLPQEMEIVIHKCLEKESQHRYSNVTLLRADLQSIRQGRPISARPPHWTRRLKEAWKRWKYAAAISVLLIILAFFLVETFRDTQGVKVAEEKRVDSLVEQLAGSGSQFTSQWRQKLLKKTNQYTLNALLSHLNHRSLPVRIFVINNIPSLVERAEKSEKDRVTARLLERFKSLSPLENQRELETLKDCIATIGSLEEDRFEKSYHHWKKGWESYRKSLWRDSIDHFKECQELYAPWPLAQIKEAFSYCNLNYPRQGAEILKNLPSNAQSFPEYQVLEFRLALEKNQLREGKIHLKRLKKQGIQSPDFYMALVLYYQLRENTLLKSAPQAIEEGLRTAPQRFDLLLKKVYMLIFGGNYGQARELALKLLEDYPYDYASYNVLIRASIGLKEKPKVWGKWVIKGLEDLNHLKESRGLSPGLMKTWVALKVRLVRYYRLRNQSQKLTALERKVERSIEKGEPSPKLFYLYRLKHEICKVRKKTAQALKYIEKCYQIYQKIKREIYASLSLERTLYYLYLTSLLENQRYTRACKFGLEACQKHPNHRALFFWTANAFLKRGKIKEAYQLVKDFVKRNPKELSMIKFLCEIMKNKRIGKWDELYSQVYHLSEKKDIKEKALAYEIEIWNLMHWRRWTLKRKGLDFDQIRGQGDFYKKIRELSHYILEKCQEGLRKFPTNRKLHFYRGQEYLIHSVLFPSRKKFYRLRGHVDLLEYRNRLNSPREIKSINDHMRKWNLEVD